MRGTLQEQLLAPLPLQVVCAGSCWGVDFGMPGNVMISLAAGAGWMPLSTSLRKSLAACVALVLIASGLNCFMASFVPVLVSYKCCPSA